MIPSAAVLPAYVEFYVEFVLALKRPSVRAGGQTDRPILWYLSYSRSY